MNRLLGRILRTLRALLTEPKKYSTMKTLDFRRTSARIALVVLLTGCPVAFADENDEVAKLYQQGNLDKALE